MIANGEQIEPTEFTSIEMLEYLINASIYHTCALYVPIISILKLFNYSLADYLLL